MFEDIPASQRNKDHSTTENEGKKRGKIKDV